MTITPLVYIVWLRSRTTENAIPSVLSLNIPCLRNTSYYIQKDTTLTPGQINNHSGID